MGEAIIDISAYAWGLAAIAALAVAAWVLSLVRRDVSHVDSLWSLFFMLAAFVYATAVEATGPRVALVLVLVSVWALRLSGYITWRNWGEEEDRRYQQIRANNEPNFAFKSLYIVFGLQGLLAWIISLPLLAAILGQNGWNLLDALGIALWLTGLALEPGGDYQLARFKANPENKGKVMDSGFWRYTRHPNYFGDFCVWWGFYLLALAADFSYWWTIIAPVIMSFFLLKVSGVAMLEKDIGERRPKYADYIKRTNAFFPGPPKQV